MKGSPHKTGKIKGTKGHKAALKQRTKYIDKGAKAVKTAKYVAPSASFVSNPWFKTLSKAGGIWSALLSPTSTGTGLTTDGLDWGNLDEHGHPRKIVSEKEKLQNKQESLTKVSNIIKKKKEKEADVKAAKDHANCTTYSFSSGESLQDWKKRCRK